MATVTTADLKAYLRLPAGANAELDPMLDGALAVASERVEVILGQPLPAVGLPESAKLAIKFLAGFYFEHPDATEESLSSALKAVSLILAPYRDYGFPDASV